MTKLDHTNPLRIFCGNLCRKPFPIFHLPLLIIFLTFSIFHFPSPMYAQAYAPADPFYLLSLEKEQFNHADSLKISSTIIRPFYHHNKKGQFTVRYRQEQYSNDNTSNQENMDVRFIGKGRGWFQGLNISYYNDFIAFSVEPYWLSSANETDIHIFLEIGRAHV